MMKVVDPRETSRAYAFEMWMRAPNPMVTLFKELDVTTLCRASRRSGMKFNMLLCWCIGKAATAVKEFYLLPTNGEMVQYDTLAVSTIVATHAGDIASCDIPFSESLPQFSHDYLQLTARVAQRGESHDIADSMVIGTSALARYDIAGAVGMYSGIFNNPFLIWGRYKRRWCKRTLLLSFQFHHTQMDGAHAAHFLTELQSTIDTLKI